MKKVVKSAYDESNEGIKREIVDKLSEIYETIANNPDLLDTPDISESINELSSLLFEITGLA